MESLECTPGLNSNQSLSAVDNAREILQDNIGTELVYAVKYFEHPLWS